MRRYELAADAIDAFGPGSKPRRGYKPVIFLVDRSTGEGVVVDAVWCPDRFLTDAGDAEQEAEDYLLRTFTSIFEVPSGQPETPSMIASLSWTRPTPPADADAY